MDDKPKVSLSEFIDAINMVTGPAAGGLAECIEKIGVTIGATGKLSTRAVKDFAFRARRLIIAMETAEREAVVLAVKLARIEKKESEQK